MISDLQYKFTVDVTQEDIIRGIRANRCSCPIARAARRALGCLVIVDHRGIFTSDYKYEHTVETKRFVNDFDAGYSVEPFSFNLPWKQ
jgi:hypothetical protein